MDNLKDTLTNVTKNVFKTSKGFLKSTKLSLDLSSEESRLKTIYVEIGKKVHEIYSYGGSLGKFFDEKYADLRDCEAKINDLRSQLEVAKGTKTCMKCGKTASATSEFCPKCGSMLDIRSEFPEQRQDTSYPPNNEQRVLTPEPEQRIMYEEAETYNHAPAPAAGKLCQVCGKSNTEESKFCFYCGRLL